MKKEISYIYIYFFLDLFFFFELFLFVCREEYFEKNITIASYYWNLSSIPSCRLYDKRYYNVAKLSR
jgi:hypothetical protein